MKKHLTLLTSFILLSSTCAQKTNAVSTPSPTAATPAPTPAPSPVMVGKDGYLFLDHEIFSTNDSTLSSLVSQLNAHAKIMRNHGSKVVFVVVPAKMQIFPDLLPNNTKVKNFDTKFHTKIQDKFQSSSLEFIDILPVLNNFRQKNVFSPWMLKDSHWSPLGSFNAGEAVGQELLNRRVLSQFQTTDFIRTDKIETIRGDLYDLATDTDKQWVTPGEKVSIPTLENSTGGLLNQDVPPYVLLGSSYSVYPVPYGSFAEGIRSGLKADINNLGTAGGGFWGGLDTLKKQDAYKGKAPKLIIWELPERYFVASSLLTEDKLQISLNTLKTYLGGVKTNP